MKSICPVCDRNVFIRKEETMCDDCRVLDHMKKKEANKWKRNPKF